MSTLAYTPFIDPLAVHNEWYLLIIPIAIFIAIGYKAIRTTDMKQYPREVFVFTMQILIGLGLLAAALTFVITVLIPMLAPIPA
jgi:prolipoprotein diacylglyceryltransferase